jgi:glutamyl-Q tRNA(Asp) synthetase
LGHAYSALIAQDIARAKAGEILLRIEDIDISRARSEWEAQIYEDLHWLGLRWPAPVMRQSDRFDRYNTALDQLARDGVVYPCFCSRSDIQNATSAPQEGSMPVFGPDGLVYPGTCRLGASSNGTKQKQPALRLNMAAALEKIVGPHASEPLSFIETGNGHDQRIEITPYEAQNLIGDVVLGRRGMGTSYHLSVVLDDAAQHISQVVRGEDLFEATKIHVILQRLLGLVTPIYHHHKLIRDEHGKRLAKRDDARAISKFRNDGATPQDIRALVGLAQT